MMVMIRQTRVTHPVASLLASLGFIAGGLWLLLAPAGSVRWWDGYAWPSPFLALLGLATIAMGVRGVTRVIRADDKNRR